MGRNRWYSCEVTRAPDVPFSRAMEVNSEGKWRAKQSQRDGVLCEPVCRVAIELLLMSALTGECPDVA